MTFSILALFHAHLSINPKLDFRTQTSYDYECMTHDDFKKILYTVYKNIRCPQCGQRYGIGKIHIKGCVQNLCFLQLECQSHMPLFATIATPPNQKPSTPIPPIDNDYVLNAYIEIGKLKNNLSSALK